MASNDSNPGAAAARAPLLLRSARPLLARPLLVSLLLVCMLSGCALRWPWKHHAPAGPAPVQVLEVQSSAAAIAQYWDGTALLLDLTTQGGEGTATLSPPASGGWPIRMEFRVQPGRIASLEVLAGERTQFEVPALGAPVVLHLRLDGYRGDTPRITLLWHAADGSAR